MSDPVRGRVEEILGHEISKSAWRGHGCGQCGDTGYYGRAAVFEYFHLDDDAREKVTGRASEIELRAYQRQNSSGSLLQNALRKAAAGITTIEDAFEIEMSV